MKKIHLSVVLATYNEAANLSRCLDSVRGLADEIVIADGASTDSTCLIAKKYHCRIIPTSNKPNFHINKNMAIDKAVGEWILQLDADEVISTQLKAEIKSVISSTDSSNGYWVNRKNWFLNRFLTKGGQYPDPTLRLYKRGLGRLPAVDVHEQAVITGPVGHLSADLLHYRDLNFEKYLVGFDRYSSLRALQLKDAGEKFSLWHVVSYLFIKPLSTFISIYFRHRGYIDAFPGFIFALFSGLIYPVTYIKYWQHQFYPHD